MSALIRVAVAGAAGRMGQAVCAAVEGAGDMQLTGRADPALGTALADVLADADVVVDFTRPDTALANALQCVEAGVHVVIGTSGFDMDPLYGLGPDPPANVFFAPNFAIGAVLMMRFAAEASQHMAKAEIIELHHDGKLDKPSGTAARTAQLMQGDVPIHSVRLPGLVAHQEVILGDLGQTLTIRHDSIDRASFMPGVLLAVRRVSDLPESPLIGLEHLLFSDPQGGRLMAEGVTVAVTDHAAERFRQRVGSRHGGFDVKPEIAGRVSAAWGAGRSSDVPPPGAGETAARTLKGTGGSVYIRDLVDRNVIFVCRHDRDGRELLVITLWEDERFGSPRVDHRFTDALKQDDRSLVDPGRRWRERRDGTA